ncbi:MAG: MATE family efflux transporter [Clostridia bacterium]|nr:MATE family efflux transporter [Clostridia bacterium]
MQKTAPQENKMGVMPIPKLIINMSLPMIASMLVQALYNIVDSFFVAQINEQSLTAVSLAFPAQNLMIGVATGTAVGVNALLSRALGEKDNQRASKIAENGVFLSFVGYAIFLIFGLFGARLFMQSQTSVSQIVDYGVSYLTVVCCCSFGLFGQIIFERLMQATGRTIYTMYTQGLGAIINIILDPVFIFVFDMGVTGAAVATVIGQIIAFGFAFFLNHKKNHDIELHIHGFRPDKKIIGRIYAIGVPSIIMVAIGSVMTFLMNVILITYTAGKETAATVFGVYFKLNSFVFMPIFGLNNGIIPIVAYNYGARNKARMLQTIKLACIYAASVMTIGLIIFEVFPAQLLSIFSASEEMLAIGIPALRIIATPFSVAGICIALGSSFQALGFGVYSMLTSFCRQLVVLVPSAWLLARLGQSVGNDSLVWYSYPIAEVASLAVTLILFIRLYKNVISQVGVGKADS